MARARYDHKLELFVQKAGLVSTGDIVLALRNNVSAGGFALFLSSHGQSRTPNKFPSPPPETHFGLSRSV
jgi:hypothetical protein